MVETKDLEKESLRDFSAVCLYSLNFNITKLCVWTIPKSLFYYKYIFNRTMPNITRFSPTADKRQQSTEECPCIVIKTAIMAVIYYIDCWFLIIIIIIFTQRQEIFVLTMRNFQFSVFLYFLIWRKIA